MGLLEEEDLITANETIDIKTEDMDILKGTMMNDEIEGKYLPNLNATFCLPDQDRHLTTGDSINTRHSTGADREIDLHQETTPEDSDHSVKILEDHPLMTEETWKDDQCTTTDPQETSTGLIAVPILSMIQGHR